MNSAKEARILEEAYRESKQRSRVQLYEKLTQTIRSLGIDASNKTLNVGSGGAIAETISNAGVTPLSLDVDPAREPDLVGSIEHLDMFDANHFDAIFCMEVLEHVQNPFAATEEIRRVLKPGGLLIGSTPFILGIHDKPHDYYRFTRYGIAHLFREFEEIEITARNSTFDAAMVLPFRLYAIGTEEEKKLMARRWRLVKLVSYLMKKIGAGIANYDAPTGYFFTFRKPMQ